MFHCVIENGCAGCVLTRRCHCEEDEVRRSNPSFSCWQMRTAVQRTGFVLFWQQERWVASSLRSSHDGI